jgi:hypothetical protein
MIRATLALAATLAFAILQSHGQSAQPVVLRTSDLSLRLQAGPAQPRLLAFAGPDRAQWKNAAFEVFPAAVEIEGRSVPLRWRHVPARDTNSQRRVSFVYESTQPHIRIEWRWQARAPFGALEHTITVQNLSAHEFWLPMIDSLALEIAQHSAIPLTNFYVEKGADTPSAQGTHFETINDGYSWRGHSTTYAFPRKGESREVIPAEIVFDPGHAQSGWFAGIEFSGRTRIALTRSGLTLSSRLGLDPEPGPFRTRLAPGESFSTPTAFLGAFLGGPDGAGNQLRPWIRSVLGNPITWRDSHYPLVVNNSWGSGVAVDEALALRMIDESSDLGMEMFHLDAGWFRNVGDWVADSKKFPHGLSAIADAAHARGLRFGLWTDWTQAALSTEPGALNVHDPVVRDWLVTDMAADWKPEEYKGQTIDIGVPAAHEWASHELESIVTGNHLDMLEHDGYLVAQGCVREDHPHAPPNRSSMRIVKDWASEFVIADNSTDVSYHAVRSYYILYEQLRRDHPSLLFEICNDGGRMVDFGSAAHGDYFSITDTYDPLSNRRAFYDASYLLPPPMLETYVEKWQARDLPGFLYMLRSGMMGWLSIMQDTSSWSAEERQAAKFAIELYKARLRPLIRDAHLYHVGSRPDGVHWDGTEYIDSARAHGVLYAFRGSVLDQSEHVFTLAGLEPTRFYKLHFQDRSSPEITQSGAQLMKTGLNVHLAEPYSSELVFLDAAKTQN